MLFEIDKDNQQYFSDKILIKLSIKPIYFDEF